MPKQPTLFLDDGGVMNNNDLRAPQWQRHVADYLAPRLGGDKEMWASANLTVAERMFKRYQDTFWGIPDGEYLGFREAYLKEWMRGMCELVSVPAPDSVDECVRIGRDASRYVTRRVKAAFPGVVDTIRELHSRGYLLHTASGEHSEELDGYLEAMGVRELFGNLYGPDRINTPKEGPLFYARMFADAGVDPRSAVVVDDSEYAVRLASEAGAVVVLVSEGLVEVDGVDATIRNLTELPGLLDAWASPSPLSSPSRSRERR